MAKGVARRARFTVPRRRRATGGDAAASTQHTGSSASVDADPSIDVGVNGVDKGILWPRLWHGRDGLLQIAKLLWLPVYDALFRVEYEHNARECGGSGYQLKPSTYRQRLSGDAAVRYDAHRMQQQRDEMAIALHANNMQRWSPSLLARSVCYFPSASTFVSQTVRVRPGARRAPLFLARASL